jgi:peptidoglycan/xylan/chitin deacetylase (PgdA/CDA1 family)
MNSPDNRAVSALFRVFGEDKSSAVGDAQILADHDGMHRGESAVLSILIPLTVIVAVGEYLFRLLGMTVGMISLLPVSFLVLSILPFILGAKKQSYQWILWLIVCVIWAFFRREAGGLVGFFAYVWIGVAILNLAASVILDWRYSAVSRALVFVGLHAVAIVIGLKFGWLWAVACGALIAASYCWAVLNPGSQWLGPIICKTNDDEILITIDDGPDPHDTPILLDLLDKYQTKAIFFMIGEKAQAHPDLVREVARRGHEIGNHTFTHPQASFWCAGPWRTRREILQCQQVIQQITGKSPRWFRAPVGHRNLFVYPIVRGLGLGVMAWSRRGYDAVEKDVVKVLNTILPNLTKGDIVLLHEATSISAQVLEGVLKGCATHRDD